MVSAAGYRSGLYTSPHLELVEERIRIDGQAIAEPPLAKLLARVLEVAEKSRTRPPTYFEALTAAAFLHFAPLSAGLVRVQITVLGGQP